MTKDNDYKYIASLVIRVTHNDSDAFTELYGMTYNKVYNYACRYLRDDYLAQDAVQEIYILALKNIDKLKDPSLFIAWLNQISFNVCYNMCNKRSGYGDITDPELLEIINDDNLSHDPVSSIEEKEEIYNLRLAIDKLLPHEKQCIILRYYNNMKIEEIVDILGHSKSTVKRHLNSAREHLGELIRKEGL